VDGILIATAHYCDRLGGRLARSRGRNMREQWTKR